MMKTKASSGFTLLEIVVVMAIIAILISFITLSLGSRETEDRMQAEAERLRQLVELATEESQLKGIQLGLQFTTAGYRFMTLDEKDGLWKTYQTSGPLRPRPLPLPLRMQLRIENRPVPPDPERQPPKNVKPQVLIYSSGQMTPFVAILSAPDVKLEYRLDADALGHVKLASRIES